MRRAAAAICAVVLGFTMAACGQQQPQNCGGGYEREYEDDD